MSGILTDLQKRAAQAIVNVFETGTAKGDYGKVTLLAGDTGHLTYGRSQTTLASGNLHLLIKAYCESTGARHGSAMKKFLDRLAARDLSLDSDAALLSLLRSAGEDPTMRQTQDAFFDRVYWDPAAGAAQTDAIATPLGLSIVYDSHVHGAWRLVRNKTTAAHGTCAAAGERVWLRQYVDTRRAWLAGHQNKLLHATVYRMDAFLVLLDAGAWDLPLPFRIRGVTIDEPVLLAGAAIRASAIQDDERTLLLRKPRMRGPDVEALQKGLAAAGIEVEVDGVFGPGTDRALRSFQRAKGLKVDGIAGPATRAALPAT